MSDLAQAALISGGIFALVMLRGYGRRTFDRRAVLMPLVMIGGFGLAYLRDMPLGSAGDLVAYALAVVVGLGFGWAACAVTGLERDRGDGLVRTVTGPAFAAIWASAVVLRLAFVWAMTDWAWFRDHVGQAMIDAHISFAAIAPFFLIWALVMVVSRMAALKVRETTLAPRRPVTLAA